MQRALARPCGSLVSQPTPFLVHQNRARPSRRFSLCRGGEGCSELPPELQDLRISEDGQYLIDNKTGKAINEYGATRFDVAVRAMRGEFDPAAYVDNTERSSGVLMECLTKFPAEYPFQLVVKRQQPVAATAAAAAADGGAASSSSSSSGGGGSSRDPSSSSTPQELLLRYRQLIADTTAADIPLEACSVKERMGGKYVSLTIPARVQAAHVIDLVWAALADDTAVIMKY